MKKLIVIFCLVIFCLVIFGQVPFFFNNVKFGNPDTFTTITISDNIWMKYNLKVNDGGVGIYKYDNSDSLSGEYGLMYTYDAALRISSKIDGWHIPDSLEWVNLLSICGTLPNACEELKEAGAAHWNTDNGTNTTGFSIVGGGYGSGGNYYNIKSFSEIWSTSKDDIYYHAVQQRDNTAITFPASFSIASNPYYYIRLKKD